MHAVQDGVRCDCRTDIVQERMQQSVSYCAVLTNEQFMPVSSTHRALALLHAENDVRSSFRHFRTHTFRFFLLTYLEKET